MKSFPLSPFIYQYEPVYWVIIHYCHYFVQMSPDLACDTLQASFCVLHDTFPSHTSLLPKTGVFMVTLCFPCPHQDQAFSREWDLGLGVLILTGVNLVILPGSFQYIEVGNSYIPTDTSQFQMSTRGFFLAYPHSIYLPFPTVRNQVILTH